MLFFKDFVNINYDLEWFKYNFIKRSLFSTLFSSIYARVFAGWVNPQNYACGRRLNMVRGGRGIRNYLCG